jgi:hypothetical protein
VAARYTVCMDILPFVLFPIVFPLFWCGAVWLGGFIGGWRRIAGVRFHVFVLFRVGHPAFFVPWEDLTVTEYRGWFVSGARLHNRRVPGIRIHVLGAAGAALLEEAKPAS